MPDGHGAGSTLCEKLGSARSRTGRADSCRDVRIEHQSQPVPRPETNRSCGPASLPPRRNTGSSRPRPGSHIRDCPGSGASGLGTAPQKGSKHLMKSCIDPCEYARSPASITSPLMRVGQGCRLLRPPASRTRRCRRPTTTTAVWPRAGPPGGGGRAPRWDVGPRAGRSVGESLQPADRDSGETMSKLTVARAQLSVLNLYRSPAAAAGLRKISRFLSTKSLFLRPQLQYALPCSRPTGLSSLALFGLLLAAPTRDGSGQAGDEPRPSRTTAKTWLHWRNRPSIQYRRTRSHRSAVEAPVRLAWIRSRDRRGRVRLPRPPAGHQRRNRRSPRVSDRARLPTSDRHAGATSSSTGGRSASSRSWAADSRCRSAARN